MSRMEQKKEPALVIMAAGIGSRYGGGIKQLEAVARTGRSSSIIQFTTQSKWASKKLSLLSGTQSKRTLTK